MTESSQKLYPLNPVLIVDDEPAWLRSLTLALERALGVDNIIQAEDGDEALDIMGQMQVGLVLLDITMPNLSGDRLLEIIVKEYPEVPVIVFTGRNEVELAVKCMKSGAFDYFLKTGEQERFIAGVRRALAMAEMREENLRLRQGLLDHQLEHPEAFAQIIAASPAMQKICKYLEAIAVSSEPILITGESGTGKELVARAIHWLEGVEKPWQAVNVAGLDDHVFSDTLFGHVRGAFTGADRPRRGLVEQAESGILFLDEIGDLSPASQVKLLRFLQEREYHPLGSDRPKKAQVRLVAATNLSLEERIADGRFRKDLFFRLKAHHVHLPPLRERPEDLPLLLEHFLIEAAETMEKKNPTPPRELVGLLQSYSFPGNIRELRSMTYDAVSRHQSGGLSLKPFEEAMGLAEARPWGRAVSQVPEDGESSPIVFPDPLPTMKELGDLLIQEALRRADGNQSRAAKMIGITRPTLAKRLRQS